MIAVGSDDPHSSSGAKVCLKSKKERKRIKEQNWGLENEAEMCVKHNRPRRKMLNKEKKLVPK